MNLREVVTLEAVLAAYQKTGIKPVCGVWTESLEGTCGCALVALVCAIPGVPKPADLLKVKDTEDTIARLLKISKTDVQNFIRGFDNPNWAALQSTEALLAAKHGSDIRVGLEAHYGALEEIE